MRNCDITSSGQCTPDSTEPERIHEATIILSTPRPLNVWMYTHLTPHGMSSRQELAADKASGWPAVLQAATHESCVVYKEHTFW